jgi:holo-[acyl-carrier protein] synthase
MSIVGHGVDVVEVDRFAKLLADQEGDFVHRCFTAVEQAALRDSADQIMSLAGRFAAKEAIAKALGTGFTEVVSPLDIEIRDRQSGQPFVTLRGGAAEAAARMGVTQWHMSISHTSTVAIASAIAVR